MSKSCNTIRRIIRVQWDNGEGPYIMGFASKYSGDWGENSLYSSSKHPSPFYDCGRNMYADEFCGFSSFKRLLDWFPLDSLRFFYNHGGRVVIYHDIQPTVIGGCQCLFIRPENAKPEKLSLPALRKIANSIAGQPQHIQPRPKRREYHVRPRTD